MTTIVNGLGQASTTNPYPAGQCTWAVWQYIHDNYGVDMPDMSGNATNWGADAQAKGWNVGSAPTVGTVVCWSSSKYPPDGHVAFVTQVALAPSSPYNAAAQTQSFTVYEGNFDKSAPYPPPAGANGYDYTDTRTINVPSSDADGIEGFIDLSAIGIQPGTTGSTNPGTNSGQSNPWGDFTSALQTAEQQAQQQIDQGVKKAIAMAQIGAGAGVLAGGVYLLQAGLRGQPAPQPVQAIGGLTRRTSSSRGRRPVPPAQEPVKRATEASRDAVLGQESRIAASVQAKIARGRMADLTPAETAWMQANPGAVRAAFQNAPTRRVTAAGRTRTLP